MRAQFQLRLSFDTEGSAPTPTPDAVIDSINNTLSTALPGGTIWSIEFVPVTAPDPNRPREVEEREFLMGNTKLYAFAGELLRTAPDTDHDPTWAERIGEAVRGYASAHIEPDGYLGQGRPWLIGSAHSHSVVATGALLDWLRTYCGDDFELVMLDLEQAAFAPRAGGVLTASGTDRRHNRTLGHVQAVREWEQRDG